MEIIKTYNCVPTIAVFTINKRVAEELKEALDECDNLVRAGIEVKVCSDNTLEGDKTLRIFPIDQVKGMEFEAVFFYDIDEIESTSLINKYLYVGLSRASMYLAVTSNGRSQKISNMLQKYFTTDTTWR
jgi:DNA helicase IV